VKRTDLNNGVVIVPALEGKTSLELQCNNGVPSCTALTPGDYTMVRLPKNRGMYDCANVEIYPKSGDPETATKVGAYCLTDRSEGFDSHSKHPKNFAVLYRRCLAGAPPPSASFNSTPVASARRRMRSAGSRPRRSDVQGFAIRQAAFRESHRTEPRFPEPRLDLR
jgi:hypothetical protein